MTTSRHFRRLHYLEIAHIPTLWSMLWPSDTVIVYYTVLPPSEIAIHSGSLHLARSRRFQRDLEVLGGEPRTCVAIRVAA